MCTNRSTANLKVQHYSIMMRQCLSFSSRSSSWARLWIKEKAPAKQSEPKKRLQTVSLSEQRETGSCSQVRGGQAKQKADTEQGNVCLCQVQCSKRYGTNSQVGVFPRAVDSTELMPFCPINSLTVSSQTLCHMQSHLYSLWLETNAAHHSLEWIKKYLTTGKMVFDKTGLPERKKKKGAVIKPCNNQNALRHTGCVTHCQLGSVWFWLVCFEQEAIRRPAGHKWSNTAKQCTKICFW